MTKKPAALAKYQDQKTGATWSGHGRAPAWITSAKDRSKLLVGGNAVAASAPPTRKAVKSGNYVRGQQPAMYLDPKTGAMWSGRGKAPAWLAGAKDGTKFLIVNAQSSTAKGKAAATKQAAKKVAKKTDTLTIVSKKASVRSKAAARQAAVE